MISKFRLQAVLLIVMMLSAVSAAESPAASSAPGRDFKIEVKPEGFPEPFTFQAAKLFAHADYLASDECEGRLAGSPGEAKARDYIIARLKEAGFGDVRHFPFDFIADVGLGRNNALAVEYPPCVLKNRKPGAVWYRAPNNDSGAASYKLDEDFRPLRISESAALHDIPLVFTGYGISAPDKGYDDYKGLDVKGKAVLVIRTEPQTPEGKHIGVEKADPHASPSIYSDLYYKASTARDKGAAALVIVNGKRGLSAADRATLDTFQRLGGRTSAGIPIIQVFPEVADDWLSAAGKDIPALQTAIDERLAPQSFELPNMALSLNVDIARERSTDENLAAILPGNDPLHRDEILVIGAHYDHLGRGNEYSLADKSEMGKIHRGADDNASGVSAVLELAAALHKNRSALKRTVWIMFFGAEELGTLGSNAFVKTPPPEFTVAHNIAMLNLDMVGRCRDKNVMAYGVATGVGFDAVLKQANEGLGLNVKPSADGFGGSDQTAFVTAGVPVLFFFTGSHSDYHKPSDTADKLNVADQALICALVYKTAAILDAAPNRPKFVKVETPKMSGGFGGTGLGTLPDYAYEGKGLRLSGVRANSPADRAGLKAGDIIVKLGDFKIENIYDYMNALKQSTAGVETTAVVRRDDKDMTVKVIPEKR